MRDQDGRVGHRMYGESNNTTDILIEGAVMELGKNLVQGNSRESTKMIPVKNPSNNEDSA